MTVQRLYIGGWFQRTTLHLSEIYDFLRDGSSPLALDPAELAKRREALGLADIALHAGDFDRIEARTTDGIVFRVYEDGLIVFGKDPSGDLSADIEALKAYYETKLSPGIGYIFSLGAPVPKELANIKTIYPYFVVLRREKRSAIEELLKQFAQAEQFEIVARTFEIYRGDKLYVVNDKGEGLPAIERFIEEQIFLREFKGQLHRYLNLHRIIWEKIADVKERGEIRGSEIGAFRTKVEGYAKTITLIKARINQMGTYIRTREAVAKSDPGLAKFSAVLKFRYETLADTLAYVKEIWAMTESYVNSSLALFGDLQAKSTDASVKNLTIVTSMGVGATLIGLFATKTAPAITWFGVGYFLILAVLGYTVNKIMKTIYARRAYAIKEAQIDKNIG